MKTLGILVAAIAITCVFADRAEWKQWKEDCLKKVDLTEDDFKTSKDDFLNPKIKCFHTCIMKIRGIMVDNKIDASKIIENLEKNKPNLDESIKNKVKECANEANKETTECDVGGVFKKCVFEFFINKKDDKSASGVSE